MKKKKTLYLQKNTKQKFPQKSTTVFNTVIIIRKLSWAANLHIRMISEGSCDIEHWSSDAENSAVSKCKIVLFSLF